MKIDVMVKGHDKNETSDGDAKFKVTLEGLTLANEKVRVSIRGEEEKLFKEYPLRDFFCVALSKPQQKLPSKEE